LKPGFHLIGSRVETRRLSSSGCYGSTCTAPHRDVVHLRDELTLDSLEHRRERRAVAVQVAFQKAKF
jgi:hypothetical protein